MRAGCRALPGSATQPRRPRPYRPPATRGARAPRHREPLQRHLRKARSLEACLVTFPCRDQHRDRLRMQASSHEQERIGGRTVKPLRIVDQAEQRAVESQLPRAGLEAPVPSGKRRPTGRKSSRTLLEGPPPEALEDCPQARDTASPADAAPRTESPPPTGRRYCEGHPSPRTPLLQLQQRRLADARLPPNDKNATSALAGVRKQ